MLLHGAIEVGDAAAPWEVMPEAAANAEAEHARASLTVELRAQALSPSVPSPCSSLLLLP